MKLKTFHGRTMAEVLVEVKRQFGKNAVILNTRSLTKGGLFGLGARSCVEITAVPDITDLPEPLRHGASLVAPGRSDRKTGPAGPMSPVPLSPMSVPHALLTEMGALKSMVSHLVRETKRGPGMGAPDGLYDIYLQLVRNAVADDIAAELVDALRRELSAAQLQDEAIVRGRLKKLLEPMIPTAGPLLDPSGQRPTIIALVGPTGVGKTTTVAKLAANLCLRENRKIGLVTIDTYRIAAVEQLRTYAQIIDVPLEVANTPLQLSDAIRRMADREVILIDTAGRSQRDSGKIAQLNAFFDIVRPHEVHLVLSSTCSELVLGEAIDRFESLGIDRVIFTKLDEAVGFGVLLTCLKKTKARLSYVTTGQDVPEDIEVGNAKRLASLIVSQEFPMAHSASAAGKCA